jgi:hypothetical protein
MEHIPNHLFDLLDQKDFKTLNAEEQASVLACMDEQTYTSMRNATIVSHRYFEDEQSEVVNPKQLQYLLNKVDAQQAHETGIVWNKPIAMWKVAAMFLLLGGGWLVFMLANQHKVVHTSYITQLDTVFVEKEVPAEKIHDTVYIEYERKHQRKQMHPEERLPSESYSTPVRETNIVSISDVNIVHLKEKDEPINNKKGNSIKDDSLINAFGFVTL